MVTLAELPDDVFSTIVANLPVADISTLRRINTALHHSISCNKQLWVKVVQEEVIEAGIPLPTYRRPLENIDASGVEAWVRHALSLQRAYNAPSYSSLCRLSDDSALSVTWVKLIRGRWCLIASSNLVESHLTLWDGSSLNGGPSLCAKHYLPGTVLDGQIDDTLSSVFLALSIGTKDPYIQILSISREKDTVYIHEEAKLAGASHTRFLQGTIVGFVVQDGDDSFPRIVDWKSGNTCLFHPHRSRFRRRPEFLEENKNHLDVGNENVPDHLKHYPCWAMAIWGTYVVVMSERDLQIYDTTEFRSNKNISIGRLEHTIHIFPETGPDHSAREAHIFVRPSSCSPAHPLPPDAPPSGSLPTLYIITRDPSDCVDITEVQCHFTDQARPLFSHSHTHLESGCSSPPIVLGSSNTQVIFHFPSINVRFGVPQLHIASVIHLNTAPAIKESAGLPSYKSFLGETSCFLPLHFFPRIDFDDSRGVLLMGNARGEACLVRFVPEGLLIPASLDDDLPRWPGANLPSKASSEPIAMDLPLYYSVRMAPDDDVIRQALLDETIHSWSTPGVEKFTLPGWSNDWTDFEDIHLWTAPLMLWGYADPTYWDHSTATIVRSNGSIFGNPIPVMYWRGTVVFRVGDRLYVRWRDQSFSQGESQILLPFHRFLQDHRAADPFEPGLHRYSSDRLAGSQDDGISRLLEFIGDYDLLLEYLALRDEELNANPNPETWSTQQWQGLGSMYMYYAARSSRGMIRF